MSRPIKLFLIQIWLWVDSMVRQFCIVNNTSLITINADTFSNLGACIVNLFTIVIVLTSSVCYWHTFSTCHKLLVEASNNIPHKY